MTNSNLAILGGTFDPIHYGHLGLASAVLALNFIDDIHFVPCYQPVHREKTKASTEHRIQMLKLAIKNHSHFHYNPIEINSQKPSFAINTLEQLHQEFPDKTLYWIMGADAFVQFHQWHRYQDILKLANLIVASRPEAPLPTNGFIADLLQKRQIKDHNPLQPGVTGCIIPLSITPMAISATDVRQQCHNGNSPTALLPIEVIEYIHQHKIY